MRRCAIINSIEAAVKMKGVSQRKVIPE